MKIGFLIAVSGCLCLSVPAWAVPVAGRVVDANQKPVAGASVRVFVMAEGNHPEQKLVTDAAGGFRADFPDATPARVQGVTLALAQVRVMAPGYALSQFLWRKADDVFTLSPGKSWGGTVLSEDEKPLAGVRIKISSFKGEGEPTYFGGDAPSALTDAKGSWKIDNLPLSGGAHVVISDPRWQAQGFDLSLSKPEAPPLFAHPGAAVRGRLLRPDGKPIVGAQINSSGASIEEVLTDKEGRFTLSGLAPGDARLSSFTFHRSQGKFVAPDDYVVISKRVAALKAGEVRDSGDWTAQKGTLVSGLVVDKDTKKPLAGATVNFYDAAASSTAHYSDEKGHYEVRVSEAGANSAYFRAENYLNRSLNSLSIPKGAATFELPPVELELGVRVAGTARLADGSAFDAGFSAFNLTAKGIDSPAIASGENDGNFSFSALRPGKYELSAGLPSNYGGGENRYELVSPSSFSVPPVGQKMAPLRVVLKRIAGEAKPPSRLIGRVLDEAGRGVAGAVVGVKNGNFTYPMLAVSNADGGYELPNLLDGAKISIVSIERPGYVSAAKPSIARQGEALRAADAVLKRRGARFAGRVVDAAGRSVAGAWVAPLEFDAVEPVKTASDGTFSILDLPAGDFTLLAAQNRLSVSLKTSANARNIELRLAPPAPVDVQALVQKYIARGPGWWSESDFNRGLGVERMEQLLLKGAQNQPVDERTALILGWFIGAAARHEPQWTLQNATRLLALFPDAGLRREAETSVAMLRASSSDLADQKAAQAWLDAQSQTGDISAATVARFLSMARVASALKRPEAPGLLDFAAQIGDQLSASVRLESAMKWGTELAPLGETVLARMVENWDAPARLAAWSGAVKGLAEAGDFESARRALKKVDTLASDPTIKAIDLNSARIRSTLTTPVLVVEGAHSALARALSEVDPAAALREVAFITDVFARQRALLSVANGARLRGDKTVATQALRQVFEINVGNTEPYALAAWYGAQIDPALGQELFAQARARLDAASPGMRSRLGIGDLAYYLARLDPAQSRVLVEREWSEREPNLSKPDVFGDFNTEPTKLVRAMLVIDAARGAEMATQLEVAEKDAPDEGRQRARTRTGWISALTADAAAQARGDLEER